MEDASPLMLEEGTVLFISWLVSPISLCVYTLFKLTKILKITEFLNWVATVKFDRKSKDLTEEEIIAMYNKITKENESL